MSVVPGVVVSVVEGVLDLVLITTIGVVLFDVLSLVSMLRRVSECVASRDLMVVVSVKLRSVLGLVMLVVSLVVIVKIATVSEWIRWFA